MRKKCRELGGEVRGRIAEYKEKLGMEAWELHSHTKFKMFGIGRGSDGQHSIRKMMKTASKRGLDGLLITNHNATGDFKRAQYWADHYGIKTLPATEISTKNGHLIGIFPGNVTTKHVRKKLYGWDEEGHHYNWSANKVAQKIHELGGVAILAHPNSTKKNKILRFFLRAFDSTLGIDEYGLESCISELDGIEEINAIVYKPSYQVKAEKYGKAAVAVSDAHTKYSIGLGTTYVPPTEQADELLDHIRHRKTEPVLIEDDMHLRHIDYVRFFSPIYLLRCCGFYLKVFGKTIYSTVRYHCRPRTTARESYHKQNHRD